MPETVKPLSPVEVLQRARQLRKYVSKKGWIRQHSIVSLLYTAVALMAESAPSGKDLREVSEEFIDGWRKTVEDMANSIDQGGADA